DEGAGGERIRVRTEFYLSRHLDRLCECPGGIKTRVPEHGRVGSPSVDVPCAETGVAQARIATRVELRQRAAGDEHISGTNRPDGVASLTVAKRYGHIPHADDPLRLRRMFARFRLLPGVLPFLRETGCHRPRENSPGC